MEFFLDFKKMINYNINSRIKNDQKYRSTFNCLIENQTRRDSEKILRTYVSSALYHLRAFKSNRVKP